MAAKGSTSKELILNKLKEIYPESFIASDGKTLRIPMTENGEVVEIKVTLTAAKDIEGNSSSIVEDGESPELVFDPEILKPTEEEIQNTRDFISALNLGI